MALSPQQLLRNSIWTFLEFALYPLLMIIATPVFINRLGIEMYGLWMLINTITLAINALNIGVGDTNIRLISKYRAEDNHAMIHKVFHYNFSLSIFLFFAAVALGLLFYTFVFISVFYKGDDLAFASLVLLLAYSATVIKFVEIAVVSVFKAFERFDISSRLVLLSKNSVMAVNILLIYLGYGLVGIFTSPLVINLLNIVVQLIMLN